jgi:hypothetical protein
MHPVTIPLQVFVRLFIAGIILSLSACSGSRSQLDKLDAAHQPAYTTDITFGSEVKGTASRSRLFGFIEWGDNAYFNMRDLNNGQMGIAHQNGMTERATAAAAHNALDGNPKSIIVDPQLTIKESNFILFKKYKATVSGYSAQKSNFRQIKRFNTDETETLPLSAVPQEYRFYRDGNETMRVSATNNLSPHVAKTIRIFDRDEKETIKKIEELQLDESAPPLPATPPLIQPEAAAQQFQHPVIQNVVERQRQRKFYLLKAAPR